MKSGFSLIELMMVFAVVSVLACMAYPSYQHYLIRTHRIDGQMALLDLASRMEQYYAQQNTYQTATIATGAMTDVLSQALSPEGWYHLAIITASDSTFALQAIPTQAQAAGDTHCQVLTFNSVGVKGIASGPVGAPTGAVSECW